MTNKNVGANCVRPMKKILSLVLSLVMLCTMITTFGITASAEEPVEYNISTINDFSSRILDAGTTPTILNITKNLVSADSVRILDGQNITINLNSHTVECSIITYNKPCTLTINGPGTIKATNLGDSALSCIDLTLEGTVFTANNVKIFGGNAPVDGKWGEPAVKLSLSNGTFNNCYLEAGKSTVIGHSVPAVKTIGSQSKIYIKNSTFVRHAEDASPDEQTIGIFDSTQACDFDSKEPLTIEDLYASPLNIGNGYTVHVSGNTIDQSNSENFNAEAQTPVSATAAIPAPTYTVTIPSTVNFDEQKQALAKYKVSDKDQYGKPIKVSKPFTISATNVDNLFDDLGKKPQIDVAVTFDGLLKDSGTATIPYTVKKGNEAFTSGKVFCSFTNSSEVPGEQKAEGTIWINRTDITKTADYTGTMTFTISIPDAEQEG